MQVVEDSKFNLVSSVNKYSSAVNTNNTLVGNSAASGAATTTTTTGLSSISQPYNNANNNNNGNGLHHNLLRNEHTPKVQYLGPNCLLIVYNEKEIATLLDEHFTKSLSGSNEHRTTHRTFPPSFWNRYYYRSPRNTASSTSMVSNQATNAAAASSFGYYPDPYSSLLRPPGSSLWTQYAAAGTSSQSSSVGPSRDFADVYYGGLPDSNRLHLTDSAHSTYNQLLGLGRTAATRIQPPPQYSAIRGDWPVFPAASDYPQSTYPFQTGAETVSSHGAHAETQIKETPFWFPVA